MIILLTASGKGHTWRDIVKWPDMPRLKRWSYWHMVHLRKVPHATYIFTDFDRLSPWERELAARLYRFLKKSGVKVLNDPAKFLNRYEFLKTMKNNAINDFDVWSAGLDETPDRYPVFLRTQAAHRGPIGGLLHSRQEANQALQHALCEGYVKADLIFVEFCAQRQADGIFHKLATNRIGSITVPGLGGYDTDWHVKGLTDAGANDIWRHSLDHLRNNFHADTVMKAFTLANLDYGRADFAVINGRPQIYEINTNPKTAGRSSCNNPSYIAAFTLRRILFTQAMNIIDTRRSRPAISLDDKILSSQRRKDWPSLGYHRAIR